MILLVLIVLDIFFIFYILFAERDDPTRVLHWLMILLFLPILGAILFLIFHQDHRRKRKKFESKAQADLGISVPEDAELPPPAAGAIKMATGTLGEYRDLALLVSRSDPKAPLRRGNRLRLFVDGNEKFAALLEDLRGAKEDVHLEYYIMRNDALAKAILDVLAERARAGVEVRLLLDAAGGRAVKKRTAELVASGARVAFFYPGVARFNYRNHRKIAIIDGRVGYCGGYNIGDEYLGKGPLGYWRDAALRVVGPGANPLQVRFLRDWLFASRERMGDLGRYFWRVEEEGSASVQEVSSGPDADRPWIKESYLKMISMARESCYIQTPYFVPGMEIMEALRVAASSGVDVRVMIPNRPDHPFVYWATQSFCADLLSAGVTCYQYARGFIHAKTVVVDGKVSSVGSANFDRRSFALNFETNLIAYDAGIGAAMKAAFIADQARCTELTGPIYAKRGLGVKFKEPISRLFYPIA